MVVWPVLCFGVLCVYIYEYMILVCMCAYMPVLCMYCVCVMCVVEKVCMSVWAAHVR